jgi:2-polyprenyl-3-methyl-5-hydroxy-6-metoxy-1,4-benzoquinol methylase
MRVPKGYKKMAKRKGEPLYEEPFNEVRARGLERLGLMTSYGWYDDPKRLVFTLARYKFVAKMFDGLKSALEVGCGDGFGSRVVAQSVGKVTGIDLDCDLLESAKAVASDRFKIDFVFHDMLTGPFPGKFEGVYSMDVLEHIRPKDEARFLKNMIVPLDRNGVCIIGTPSVESQAYASKYSKLCHVNCKSQADLKATMKKYFHNVFMFSMNDEVIHTGFGKMSHYNIALCCSRKTKHKIRY